MDANPAVFHYERLMLSENGESLAIAEDIVQPAVTIDSIEVIPMSRRAISIDTGSNARREAHGTV